MCGPGRSVLLAHSYYLAHDAKQWRKMKPYPPLATLLVASVLRERGFDVELFDAMLAGSEAEFARALDASGARDRRHPRGQLQLPDEDVHDAEPRGRPRDGGRGPRARAPRRRERLGRDRPRGRVPRGRRRRRHPRRAGASTFAELAARVDGRSRGGARRASAGLALAAERGRRPPAVRRTPIRPFVENLDALPLPAWDLVDADAYRAAWTRAHGRLSWNVVTTRGCPFHCNWCAKPLYGTRYAQRSPANVADEVRRLADDGPAGPPLVRGRHLRPDRRAGSSRTRRRSRERACACRSRCSRASTS